MTFLGLGDSNVQPPPSAPILARCCFLFRIQNNKCTSTGLAWCRRCYCLSVLETICLTGQDGSRRPPVMQVLTCPFMDIYIQRASWSLNTSTTGITTVPLKRNSVTPVSLKKGNGSHPFDCGDHYMREVNIRKGGTTWTFSTLWETTH